MRAISAGASSSRTRPLGSLLARIQELHIKPPTHAIPDAALYRPLFSPWIGGGRFARHMALAAPRTVVSPDRCWLLCATLTQSLSVEGEVWECGVYKGGTAAMLASLLRGASSSKSLRLFDTFEGMPKTDTGRDWHQAGDFADTSAESVAAYVGGGCDIRKGFIPHTFAGLETSRIAFAHVDVDIYQSVLDSIAFIWPRLSVGGFVVFDDYGFPTCPGARSAVDAYFAATGHVPLCLPTGQALVVRSF